jgi:hypothetical protein
MTMTDTATTEILTNELDPNAIGVDFDGETENDEPVEEEE